MFDLNQNIPLLLSLVFIVGGLLALSWSADRFVDGAGALARAFGVSPLIVGMVIIGFGTSAPELVVSVLSAIGSHSNLSLGNAYGSCIFNIAAILGVAALIRPLAVKRSVTLLAVPLLLGVTAVSCFLVWDGQFERSNGLLLLGLFAVAMPFYCWFDQRAKDDAPGEATAEPSAPGIAPCRAWVYLAVGLVVLVGSSHVLVWGCVDFARDVLHVSDLMIGLTVVAMGTSLPELASAVASARKGEHEFVIGNIVGSNLFNCLGVVGVAGSISPFGGFSGFIVTRDLPVIALLTVSVFAFGFNWRRPSEPGRIGRVSGVLWILAFAAYLGVMIAQETGCLGK